MKVTIVGAGAGGLSTAIAVKTALDADVRILERARAGDAPGLGVALLPYAREMLRLKGFQSYADRFLPIDRTTEVFAGHTRSDELTRRSGFQDHQYWGVKRAALLEFLTDAARTAGVEIEYDFDVSEDTVRQEKDSSDLLIGADGAGSLVRNTYAAEFSPRSIDAKSRYAWLELEGQLDHFVFGYMYVAGKGLIRVTAYPHSPQECSAIVTHSMALTSYFDEAGMVDADGSISAAGMQALNDIFSRGLGGRRLAGKSRWRRFKATHCQRAAFANVALVGDACATLFYETGWGTSVAIQASSMLCHALLQGKTVAAGLEIYNDKSAEISRGAITATTRAMKEVDGQSAKFFQLGAAKFLEFQRA